MYWNYCIEGYAHKIEATKKFKFQEYVHTQRQGTPDLVSGLPQRRGSGGKPRLANFPQQLQ